eukprot:gb/GEZN01004403.1/.p1 GENE.gb/GEZN01004403.1/~~gb/GEZN01004403.1/.p1  ORF type:complete len:556 (-),score=42.06 gb/GEZN01004403.1/:252-1919(-)
MRLALRSLPVRPFAPLYPLRRLQSTIGKVTSEQILRGVSSPLHSPSYPRISPGYRFVDREYMIIAYHTDPKSLSAVVPWPLRPRSDIILMEWISMPDSSGFGDYQESGQVIPCQLPDGSPINYTLQMFLNCEPPIAGGREIWGFPKKFAEPSFIVDHDTLLGRLQYGSQIVAMGTMAYKHTRIAPEEAMQLLSGPQCNLKLISSSDFSRPHIAQLVKYKMRDVTLKEAWRGPAKLHLIPHINAPVADHAVRAVSHGLHLKADITLPFGEVLYDYLAKQSETEANRNQAEGELMGLRTSAQILAHPVMPSHSPSYLLGSRHMDHRSHLRVHYRTSLDALLAMVPSDLIVNPEGTVIIEWIKSKGDGIGSFSKVAHLVSCRYVNPPVGVAPETDVLFVLHSFCDLSAQITDEREVWGGPTRSGKPTLFIDHDTVVGEMKYGHAPVASASLSYKQVHMSLASAKASLSTPRLLLKVIPSVGDPCNIAGPTMDIAELVETSFEEVSVYEAWEGSARLDLIPHVNCCLADLPVLQVLKGEHFLADMTLGPGKVVKDYLRL